MSTNRRSGADPEALHQERMERIAKDLNDADRMVRVLAEQIRVIRASVGLPPDLRLIPPPPPEDER